MTALLTKTMLSLLWAGLGVLGAWLSFLLLQNQAGAIQPDIDKPLSQLPKLIVGRTIRLVLVGVVIYIAIRMNTVYALVFVTTLSITTWLLVAKLNRRSQKPSGDQP